MAACQRLGATAKKFDGLSLTGKLATMKPTLALLLTLALLVTAIAQDAERITFTTLAGREYKDVKVTKVEADAITVMHSGGIARLDFAALPADVQKQFGYDPDAASAARAALNAANMERQRALAAQQQAREAQAASMAQEAREAEEMRQSAERKTYKVFQVLPDGLLVQEHSRGGYGGRLAGAVSLLSGGSSTTYTPPRTGEKIYLLRGAPGDSVVDDDVFDALVVQDGSAQYETVDGAVSTVRALKVVEMGEVDR